MFQIIFCLLCVRFELSANLFLFSLDFGHFYFHVNGCSLPCNKPSLCSLCKEFDYQTPPTFVAFFPKSNFRAIAVDRVCPHSVLRIEVRGLSLALFVLVILPNLPQCLGLI